jgi:hypothetical protein
LFGATTVEYASGKAPFHDSTGYPTPSDFFLANLTKQKKPAMPLAPDDPRVRLVTTSFVVYEHVDLARAEQFLLDFGLSVASRSDDGKEIFFKGYGRDPYIYVARQATGPKPTFGGAAYLVESREELEKATQIHGASAISPLSGPGGGEQVTLKDPAGHLVHLVFGRQEKPVEEMNLKKLVVNYEHDKPRKGQFQRFEPGPAPVHRWGHYGVTYPDGAYQDMLDWYTSNLALTPSDIIYRDGRAVQVFMHIG